MTRSGRFLLKTAKEAHAMQTRDLKENAAKHAGFSIETLGLAASLASLMLATPIYAKSTLAVLSRYTLQHGLNWRTVHGDGGRDAGRSGKVISG